MSTLSYEFLFHKWQTFTFICTIWAMDNKAFYLEIVQCSSFKKVAKDTDGEEGVIRNVK